MEIGPILADVPTNLPFKPAMDSAPHSEAIEAEFKQAEAEGQEVNQDPKASTVLGELRSPPSSPTLSKECTSGKRIVFVLAATSVSMASGSDFDLEASRASEHRK